MMASSISLFKIHIFACLPIETQDFPKERIAKLWLVGQIWPTTCFATAHVLRMAFIDEYL